MNPERLGVAAAVPEIALRQRVGQVASRSLLAIAMGLSLSAAGDSVAPVNPYQRIVAAAPDCPPELSCVVNLAALDAEGECNYSPTDRSADVWGITHHVTESNLADAIRTFQSLEFCRSAHYVIALDGTVHEMVPPNNIAFTAGNREDNLRSIQIEIVGERGAHPTEAQFKALVTLDRYLIKRYDIKPSSSTITGHDSVPSPNDARAKDMHTDPYHLRWGELWDALGVPAPNTEGADGSIVMINPHLGEDSPTGNNAVLLRTSPNEHAPLASDAYLHPDGSPGDAGYEDWGNKARAGHMFVVAGREPGWTGIWYGGNIVWFQDNEAVVLPVQAATVSPKDGLPIPIYGRPGEDSELSEYTMLPGQEYVAAAVPSNNGEAEYLKIFWNGRFAYVKAADITPTQAGQSLAA